MKGLFSICFAVLSLSAWTQAAKHPAKATPTHAAAAPATLAVKANTAATLLLDDKKIGTVSPNVLAQFSIGAGSHFLSLVPADEQQFRRIDTTISATPGSQLALLLRAEAVALGPKEVMHSVLKATGLDGFGKSFQTIRFTVTEPFQRSSCAYAFPESGRVHEDLLDAQGNVRSFNNGHPEGNDFILFDQALFTRYGYMMSTDADTKEVSLMVDNREAGTTGIDTGWKRSDYPETAWASFTDHVFLRGGELFQTLENAQWLDVQDETIDGKPVRKLQYNTRREVDDFWEVTERTLYVDKATSLPVRCGYQVRSTRGDYRFEYTYADYRSFGGCTLPAKVTASIISIQKKTDYFYVPECREGSYLLSNVQCGSTLADADKLFYRPQVKLVKN